MNLHHIFDVMSENVKKYKAITSNNVDGFRYGTWAELVGLIKLKGKDCYVVKFSDGVIDLWPVIDSWDEYKFMESFPMDQ